MVFVLCFITLFCIILKPFFLDKICCNKVDLKKNSLLDYLDRYSGPYIVQSNRQIAQPVSNMLIFLSQSIHELWHCKFNIHTSDITYTTI